MKLKNSLNKNVKLVLLVCLLFDKISIVFCVVHVNISVIFGFHFRFAFYPLLHRPFILIFFLEFFNTLEKILAGKRISHFCYKD